MEPEVLQTQEYKLCTTRYSKNGNKNKLFLA